MRAAYHAPSAIIAEAQLEALARELEHTHPGAAGSLREGLSETLTVLRLGVSPTLARTLRSTRCLVATDLGGPDTYLPGPPRTRPRPTSPTPKSEEPVCHDLITRMSRCGA